MKKGFFCIFLLCLFLTPSVTAQKNNQNRRTALGVNPAILETVLTPDEMTSRSLSLYNLSRFPIPIKTIVESFAPKEKIEIPAHKLNLYDASNWIKIREKDQDFILQPNENRLINIEITPPKKASPGGHYASITFVPFVPEEIVARDSIFVFGRVSVLNFLQVRGDIKEGLELTQFAPQSLYQSIPLIFNLSLKNTGNTHLRPSGRVVIENPLTGKILKTASFLPSIVLPGSTKEYPIELREQLAFGRYSVRAEVTYGVENRLIESQTSSFYFFPLYGGILAGLLGVVLLIIYIKYRSRFSRAWEILIHGQFKKGPKKTKTKNKPPKKRQARETPLGQIKLKRF